MSLFTINSETDNSTGANAAWRRYLAWYVLTLLFACAAVAGFNAIVDPQARILLVDKPGFNQVKIALETNSRKGKATALRQCNYDTLILGTSRTETAIATSYPALPAGTTYNAAQKAATVYEMRRVAEYAMLQHSLDTVIMGLDFVSFSTEADFNGDFLDSPFAETVPVGSMLRYLVSLTTLKESKDTLQWNARPNPTLCSDNGERKSIPPEAPRIAFDFILRHYAIGQYAKYGSGDAHFNNLATLLRELTDAGVKVYAFVSPVHVTHVELKREMGLLEEYESWKRRLVQVFAEANQGLAEGQQAVLWDFSAYNEITTEKVPSLESGNFMEWHLDSAHFNQRVGNMMQDRFFGLQTAEPVTAKPFGVLLTADNVEVVMQEARQDSERYRRENPAEIERMRDMLKAEF